MVVVLRLPHLVLADVGHNQRLAFGSTPEIVDHVGGVEMAIVGQVLNVADGGIALQLAKVLQPLFVLARLQFLEQLAHDGAHIADQRHVNFHVLVDLGGININVDLLGLRSAMRRSASWIMVLTQASPCMPIMPRFSGWEAGKAPSPRSVRATGISARSARVSSSSMAWETRMP